MLTRRLRNCNQALTLAETELGIPAILSADHLSSQDLDEQSCLTYLSYFVKQDAPGYKATLRDVQAVGGVGMVREAAKLFSYCTMSEYMILRPRGRTVICFAEWSKLPAAT